MFRLFIVTTLACAVAALDLTFASDVNCTGVPIHGVASLDNATQCYDLSEAKPAKSIIISQLANSQSVTFYYDNACQNRADTVIRDRCYNPASHFGSFRISGPNSSVETTEVVPYGIVLSDEKSLSLNNAPSTDIAFSNLGLGVSFFIVSGLGTLFSLVAGCYLTNSDPLPIAVCIVAPLAIVTAHAGHIFLTRAGTDIIQLWQGRLGNFPNVKREEIEASHSQMNSEYMNAVMGPDSGHPNSSHVGYMARDVNGAEQTSPMYETDLGESGKWHFSTFYDNTTQSFFHHAHPAEQTEIARRDMPSYNAVRLQKGGLDFHFCPYNKGSAATGWSDHSLNQIYKTAYDQLNCFYSSADQNTVKSATEVLIDMYNTDGKLKGALTIVAYTGSNPSSGPACNKATANLKTDCEIS